MTTGLVAAGVAALAYYVYQRSRKDYLRRAGVVEIFSGAELAPDNWRGELYLFAEGLRYIWVEIFRWPTADLFIGLAYLARQGINKYPVSELVENGERMVPAKLSIAQAKSMKVELEGMHRLLLYSKNLKIAKRTIPAAIWAELGIGIEDFIIYRPQAAVLCPAYVLVRDHRLSSLVLAIRGTKSVRDLFTSLAGTCKPHHMVDQNGVVLGYSHFGMLAAARWLMKHAGPTIKEAMKENPGYKLVITGHSMGGGAAAMLTMMIREQYPDFGDVQCFAFACPACMTLEIAKSCASYVTSVIYGADVIPTVSQAAIDQLREEVADSSWGRAFRQDVRSTRVVQALEGSIRAVRSAGAWTSRSIQSASWGLQACYTSRCSRPRRRANQPMREATQIAPELIQLISDVDAAQTQDSTSGGESPVIAQTQQNPEVIDLTAEDATFLQEVLGDTSGNIVCPNNSEQNHNNQANGNKAMEGSLNVEASGGENSNKANGSVQNIKPQGFGGYWSRLLLRRKVDDPAARQSTEEDQLPVSHNGICSTEPQLMDSENTDEIEAGDEEGIFDGRSAQESEDDDPVLPSSNDIDSMEHDAEHRKQLYPAGRILHLVPSYFLSNNQSEDSRNEADAEEALSNQDQEHFQKHRYLQEPRTGLVGGSVRSRMRTVGNIGERSEVMQDQLPVSNGMGHMNTEASAGLREYNANDEHYDSESLLEEFVLFCDVPQESYGKMRMCRSMMMDHFVPRYRGAMESVMDALDRRMRE